jgi:hypothetical protein
VPSSCYGEEQEKHTRKRRADQRALKADTDCDEYEYDDQQPKSVLLSRTVYWGLHLDVKYDARWSAFVAHLAAVVASGFAVALRSQTCGREPDWLSWQLAVVIKRVREMALKRSAAGYSDRQRRRPGRLAR